MSLTLTCFLYLSLWRTPKQFIGTSRASWARNTTTPTWRSTRSVFLSTSCRRTRWDARFTLKTQSESFLSVPDFTLHGECIKDVFCPFVCLRWVSDVHMWVPWCHMSQSGYITTYTYTTLVYQAVLPSDADVFVFNWSWIIFSSKMID